MEKIPAEFLEDAIHNLSEILDELRQITAAGHTSLPHYFSQKLFRVLHTIKGSAQTFGLNTEGQIAHEAEGFLRALQDGRVSWSAESESLLKNSLEALAKNFNSISEGTDTILPAGLIRELEAVSGKVSGGSRDLPLPENFPAEFSNKLSAAEIQALGSALSAGKEILLLEFSIDQNDFAAKFRQVRENLEKAVEVIAVASGSGQTVENTAVFRFLVAAENSPALAGAMREFSGKVLFQKHGKEDKETTGPGFSSGQDKKTEIGKAIQHGKKAAEILGKNVKFSAAGDEMEIPAQLSKTVALLLLHLVRNAVDHGIEFPLERAVLGKPANGTVEIKINTFGNALLIEVCDDGRGIRDEDKIFSAGYSSAPFVTGLSGRGVGLDAVSDAVQKIDGTIEVETKPGHGAKFKISLPLRKK